MRRACRVIAAMSRRLGKGFGMTTTRGRCREAVERALQRRQLAANAQSSSVRDLRRRGHGKGPAAHLTPPFSLILQPFRRVPCPRSSLPPCGRISMRRRRGSRRSGRSRGRTAETDDRGIVFGGWIYCADAGFERTAIRSDLRAVAENLFWSGCSPRMASWKTSSAPVSSIAPREALKATLLLT